MIQRRVQRGWAATFVVALTLLLGLASGVFAQVKDLPPKPDRYITDNAHVLDAGTLDSINSQLDQFERDTSNQIVVAIYPNLPEGAEIAQYATYTYNAWHIGQKGKDNGALLMVFINSRKMFICTGRGLEGALPDAICKDIITQVIGPRFKQRDYGGGIQAGVDAILSAAKGEYKGNGSTAADSQGSGQGSGQGIPGWVIILVIVIFIIISMNSRGGRGPIVYTSGGWGGGGFSGGGGGWSGGGSGGGGFSGGGGSSAGGGAGGSW